MHVDITHPPAPGPPGPPLLIPYTFFTPGRNVSNTPHQRALRIPRARRPPEQLTSSHPQCRNLVRTKPTMGQQGTDQSVPAIAPGLDTPNLGPKKPRNSNTSIATADKANKSAAIDQWLEEMPHQEYWNSAARINERGPEAASKK